jgi:hypothetical protein
MKSRDESEARMTEALAAYRASAHAEADRHFDDRALEVQRARILARLDLAGQRARVLPFRGASPRLGPAEPPLDQRRRCCRPAHRPRHRAAAAHYAGRQLGAS